MKTKQLANVLIKILGIYFCLEGIPSFISGVLMGLLGLFSTGLAKFSTYEWTYSIGGVIKLVVGIYFIVKSRKIAEYFFKNDDE